MKVRSHNSKGRISPPGIHGGTWRFLIIPVLLIMTIPLGVSAFMFHNNPAHTGVYDDGGTRPNNVLLWNHSFGAFQYDDPDNWTYVVDSSVYASPAVVNGIVYVGSLSNHMKAFYANNGTVIWDQLFGGDIHASPAVVNNIVYFTDYNKTLNALHASNGTIFWTADIGAAGH